MPKVYRVFVEHKVFCVAEDAAAAEKIVLAELRSEELNVNSINPYGVRAYRTPVQSLKSLPGDWHNWPLCGSDKTGREFFEGEKL